MTLHTGKKVLPDQKMKQESIKFWRETLEGTSTVLNFPYDYQRTEEPQERDFVRLSDSQKRYRTKSDISVKRKMLHCL